ncbi:hypothetical protein [Rhodopila sp.]|uniref:hypothetical protein n=1 Tax=Rhodopila sp. TaxID=2480087 RepID=UPI003D0B6FB9
MPPIQPRVVHHRALAVEAPDRAAGIATEVSIMFPTRPELAPAVRAFVDFMVEVNASAVHWRSDLDAG